MEVTQATLDQQIQSVAREIKMRERVYPRWVASGKMKRENADYELECMKAILATLIGLQASQGFMQAGPAG